MTRVKGPAEHSPPAHRPASAADRARPGEDQVGTLPRGRLALGLLSPTPRSGLPTGENTFGNDPMGRPFVTSKTY